MWKIFACLWLLTLTLLVDSLHAYTKEEVVRRGRLLCGVSSGSPGFSSVDAGGKWTGLDVDICRAVAVAVLGNASKVDYLPLAEGESLSALMGGTVDILSRHSTWTFSKDSGLPVHFAAISYYDNQGMMVAKRPEIKTAVELKKARVCGPVDSPYEATLLDYLERRRVEARLVPYGSVDLAAKGFENDACDLLSLPVSQLHGLRSTLVARGNGLILDETIAKEPFAPVVRQGDDVWLNIVRWSVYAMIAGEELGVTSHNVGEMKMSGDLAVRHLLGLVGGAGKGLGLSDDWAMQILRQVGNYGESFERNLGQSSPLRLERGLNNLWNKGGLLYAPPFR
jgi:general L-amino acid transport system substrate-binding protein